MELHYCIGLYERNELLFKPQLFQLFRLSLPRFILCYSYPGKQEFLLSVAVEGPIDDLPAPIIVSNLNQQQFLLKFPFLCFREC